MSEEQLSTSNDILNDNMDTWLARNVGRKVEVGEDVIETSPAFIVHRVLDILPNGQQITKIRSTIRT